MRPTDEAGKAAEHTLETSRESRFTNGSIDVAALEVPASPGADVHRLIENKPSVAIEIGRIMDMRREAIGKAEAHSAVARRRMHATRCPFGRVPSLDGLTWGNAR